MSTNAHKARARIADVFIRDERVSAAALVLAAFRATWVGERAHLNEKALLNAPIAKPGSGMGKNNIREAIAELKKLGVIKQRSQPRLAHNRFGQVTEVFELPACGPSGRQGVDVVRGEVFDASMSVNAIATWLFIKAGTGKGPSLHTSDLEDRFGWTEPTALKILKELMRLGRICKVVQRDKGRVIGVTYEAFSPKDWPEVGAKSAGSQAEVGAKTGIIATPKKPGNGSPCNGQEGDILTTPSTHSPVNYFLSASQKERARYVSANAEPAHGLSVIERRRKFEEQAARKAERAALKVNGDIGSPCEKAWGDDRLLAWINRYESASERLYADDEAWIAVHDVASDEDLIHAIRSAADGRVNPILLSKAGLHAFRYIAAGLVTYDREHCEERGDMGLGPLDAVRYVLNAIKARIGDREPDIDGQKPWLNTYGLLGVRLAERVSKFGDRLLDENPYANSKPIEAIDSYAEVAREPEF